jgi:hypothetical protein
LSHSGQIPWEKQRDILKTVAERFLSVQEFLRLGDAIREGDTKGIPYRIETTNPKANMRVSQKIARQQFSPQSAAAFRLLIFTGERLHEILE